jgi:ankyrin repeat protein
VHQLQHALENLSSTLCMTLQAGADVNAGSPLTPLVIAAGKGLTDCIKCLLEAGADANTPDEVSFILPFRLLVITCHCYLASWFSVYYIS